MANPFGAPQAAVGASQEAARVSSFLQKVYGWMFVGLAITALVAMGVASSPSIAEAIWGNTLLRWAVLLAPLGMVFLLATRAPTMSPGAAGLSFSIYSAINGISLSIIFLVFTQGSIATAFLTASGMFGALALYGTVTRRSLAGLGSFAFMGLIGVLIASIVGIFWQNDMFQFVLSVCGVIVFTGLTAWDAQRLRAMALQTPEGQVTGYAIVGALALYLDFINLFLFLLRLFGRRR